jgi:hypothetical protein
MWLALAVAVASVLWFVWLQIAHAPIHGNTANGEPIQNERARKPPFDFHGYHITPVAQFTVRARVLSREEYHVGREADLSPLDFALGWNRMADDAVLAQMRISQGSRFYLYRWENEPPIPPEEIVRSSANMHLAPADAGVARELDRVRTGAVVTLRGWLIDVDGSDGWHWRTSRTREDTGAGACEIIWVESVAVEEHSSG